MAHTKGTWHVSRADVNGKRDNIIYSDDENTTVIAPMNHRDGKRADEIDANSFLVAAAPDLFDALKSLADEYQKMVELMPLETLARHQLSDNVLTHAPYLHALATLDKAAPRP